MKAFAKYARLITAAAKGDDPGLSDVIAAARGVNMPKAAIDKAVQRGKDPTVGPVEELVYEGTGPEGTAFLIQALSDNKNRCRDLLRAVFNKHEGTFGASTTFLFDNRGEVTVLAEEDQEDDILAACLDAGADDVEWGEAVDIRSNELVPAATIVCEPMAVAAVEVALKGHWHVASASVVRRPTALVEISPESGETVRRMVEGFEAVDGVEDVFHNADLEDSMDE